MKRFLRGSVIGLLLLFVAIELAGRFYGLHQTPTYISSPEFEYVHAPNQDRLIYRNKFVTNEFGMRSDHLDDQREQTILLIGDSVINGGNPTDHDSLASTILQRWITQETQRPTTILNVSSGSWGPDNATAFLNKHGLFDADAMILVVSSHDAYDNMTHEPIVDVHPQFSTDNYTLAWSKLIQRGWQKVEGKLFPPEVPTKLQKSDLGINYSLDFNPGFRALLAMAEQRGIPFLIFLHPTTLEVNRRKWDRAGQEIMAFAEAHDIPLIDELNAGLINQAAYRDDIHYSDEGQKQLATLLLPEILSMDLD
jgi:lysophospholipase L1-like esterase